MSAGAVQKKIQTTADKIKEGLKCLRSHNRRTVVWPATLFVGTYEFSSTLYDISLGGLRMKLDLPLARGANVRVRIKGRPKMDGTVIWHASGFIGIQFDDDVEGVKKNLGELTVGLE